MLEDHAVGVMCESIIQMAHKLDIKVVAEGIENKEQLLRLKKLGCDYGQGFLFSRPAVVEQFESLLSQKLFGS